MKHNSAILVLKWASIATCVTFLVACNDSTEHPASSLKANNSLLDANFVSYEDDGCTVKEVSIQTRPMASQTSISNKLTLELSIRRINECNDDVHIDTTTSSDIGSSEFTLADDLSTGSLQLSKEISIDRNGRIAELDIDMIWTAQSDEEMITGVRRLNPSNGNLSKQVYAYNYKEAQASGSVILNGLNFTPIDADDAAIISVD